MDLIRFGRGIRALRLRRRWRQVDLASAAGVSRSVIARIEIGQSGSVPLDKVDRVAATLGARTDLRLSWNGEALDRLLDADHARLVELVAAHLRRSGWEVAAEVTFSIRGERGSVDLLAWFAPLRIVLVVEIKTVVPDQQAMLAAHDRKVRLGVQIAKERGWNGVVVAKLLVIRESRTARRRVDAHGTTLASEYPDRAHAVRRWLERPEAAKPLRGLWFLSDAHGTSTRHRVRRSCQGE
jgi:transcriptional regulator with XRE-family HTH domain